MIGREREGRKKKAGWIGSSLVHLGRRQKDVCGGEDAEEKRK